MDEKLRNELKARGITDEYLQSQTNKASRTSAPIPRIKAVKPTTGKQPIWVLCYPEGYEDRVEKQEFELKTPPTFMIVGVENWNQLNQGTVMDKIYLDVDGRVIIDKRSSSQKQFNDRGMPSKRLTIVFTDERQQLRIGEFWVTTTNLKFLDNLSRIIKAQKKCFADSLLKFETWLETNSYGTFVAYDYKVAGEPTDEWIKKFIEAIDIIKERKKVFEQNENITSNEIGQEEV